MLIVYVMPTKSNLITMIIDASDKKSPIHIKIINSDKIHTFVNFKFSYIFDLFPNN